MWSSSCFVAACPLPHTTVKSGGGGWLCRAAALQVTYTLNKGIANQDSSCCLSSPCSASPRHSERLICFVPTLGVKEHHKAGSSPATGIPPAEPYPAPFSGLVQPSPLPFCPPLEATHVLVPPRAEAWCHPRQSSCSLHSPSPLCQREWLQVCVSGSSTGVCHCKTRDNTQRSSPSHPSYPSTLSLKARQTTAFWWPLYSLLISPVSTHQSLARLSDEAGTE